MEEKNTLSNPRNAGRKKKDIGEKLSKRVEVNLSPEDYEKVKANAEKAGLKLPQYLRTVAVDNNAKIIAHTDLLTLSQIRKIGVNFNQMVRNVNSLHDLEIANDYKKQLDSFKEEIMNIYQYIKAHS